MAGPVLPVLARRGEIEDVLRRARVMVLTGETGSGKTTQLPQIVHALEPKGTIIHTQPRRLAARSVAARIAEEMRVPLGGLVGSKVRFEDRTTQATRIRVETDGMLLAELASNPDLEGITTVIVDEAHERSLNIDLALGALRLLRQRRPDLRVIVTSATIAPRRFSEFFGSPEVCPVVEVSGRNFGIDVRYAGVRAHEDEEPEVNASAVVEAAEFLLGPTVDPGDVLVFLPGEGEIRRCADALARARLDAEILPLFSRLSNAEQDRIFHPNPRGRPRLVLATNVAETSLTVPGIRHVIDTGLERRSHFDPNRKVQTLPVTQVSVASAEQRKGRCGRTTAGVCIRLYSKESFEARPAFTEPEIRRCSLAGVILQAASMGLPELPRLPLLDPPEAAGVREGYDTLAELGAVERDASGTPSLTAIGRRLSRLPVEPRVGRIMLAGEDEGCAHEAVVLAGVLSIQDPRERPLERQQAADAAHAVFRHESSDFLSLLNLWEQYREVVREGGSSEAQRWCREHFVNASRMREWGDLVRQLRSTLRDDPGEPDEFLDDPSEPPAHARPREESIHRALMTGLLSNLACRESDGGSFEYRGVKGNRMSIFPGSVLFKKGPKWIMAAEIVQTTRLYARTVAAVDVAWIEELASHVLERQTSDPHLDPDTGEPSQWERLSMHGIVVAPRRRVPLAKADPVRAREVFIREALVLGKWAGAGGGVARVRGVFEQAEQIVAKLRRREVLRPTSELVGWFERALPPEVMDPGTFAAWRAEAGPQAGVPTLADLVDPATTAEAPDESRFPDRMTLGEEASASLAYRFAPGSDDDGLTATIALADLPLLTPERAAWLVPGMLHEVIAGLIRAGEKLVRASIERAGSLGEVSKACAEVMTFGQGSLRTALAESLDVLYGVRVEPTSWSESSLPAWLRLGVRVIDDAGKVVAEDRDLAELHARLAGRVSRARAGRARARFSRTGIASWDFGTLPEMVETDEGPMYPAIVDEGAACGLTLVASREEARSLTWLGLRRLFAMQCAESVSHDLVSMEGWGEWCRNFGGLGSAEELRDGLVCLVAERVFLAGAGAPAGAEEFEERVQSGYGRLSAAAREVADAAGRTFEARARVAGRLGGGVNRNWAMSAADLREQAAYLMPTGFLRVLTWERFREYPRYAGGMRQRLLSLREDGSGNEKELLAEFGPLWKKYTAWVASAMSAERARAEAAGEATAKGSVGKGGKTPLPQARRAAPTVNVDAGAWAMMPGRLPPGVEAYRWALEELRLSMFAPELAARPAMTAARVASLAAGLKGA